jgi:hypothetical protein
MGVIRRGRMLDVLVALILGLIFTVGIVVAINDTYDRAGPSQQRNAPHSANVQLRRGLTPEWRVKPGFEAEVAWFQPARQSWLASISGKKVRVWIKEAAFDPDRITNFRAQPGRSTLLVNSVDETQSISGGISGPIGVGCGLERFSGQLLSDGDVADHPCAGPYATASGVTRVANVAIVSWKPGDLGTPSCFETYLGSNEESYPRCVEDAVRKGIGEAFSVVDPSGKPYDAVILPSIGTGTGPLEKERFYEIFFEVLLNKLGGPGSSTIPQDIYLQVWSNDTPRSFASLINGVKSGTATAVSTWTGSPRTNSFVGIRLAGIAGGIGILMIAFSASRQLALRWPKIYMLMHGDAPLILLALLVISYGLADGFARILPSVGRYDAPFQLALGFVTTLLGAPMARALKQAEEAMRTGSEKTET